MTMMDVMIQDCKELQEAEWEALQGTYPEMFTESTPPSNENFVVLSINVTLKDPLPLQIIGPDNSIVQTTLAEKLKHLPPFHMSVQLPSKYPLAAAPVIQKLETNHEWLPSSTIPALIQILMDKWDQGQTVLGVWVDFLQTGDDVLSSLGCLKSDPPLIRLSHSSPESFGEFLISYNRKVLRCTFDSGTHSCPICLGRLLGSECVSLSPCDHTVCRKCLVRFWGQHIAEGSVTKVGCPYEKCVRERSQASAADVNNVLTEKEATRWKWLLQKQELEQDPTLMHCPVVSCQRLVKPPPPAPDGKVTEWDRLRVCECGLAFCMFCRRVWHGPHTPCPVPTDMKFIEDYLNSTEDSPQRQAIEKRYGKSNLLKVIKKYLEDKSNREWFDKETMPCPGCKIRVQKNDGCNHMTCSRCFEHFCYQCGARLAASDPYAHFNHKHHPCRLFDEDITNNEWVFDIPPEL